MKKGMRLENVINEVKNARKGKNHAWIFNDNGEIKKEVLTCEVLDLLEELKDYEINVNDDYIENFNSDNADNTYNYGGNISNDLNYEWIETKDGSYIYKIMVHLSGDIRGGYSDYFIVKFDNEFNFYELESTRQSKRINDRYSADLNIFSETYEVYDNETENDVNETFYELEVDEVLEKINNI